MEVIFITTTLLFAVLFGYSIMVLKTLREEIKSLKQQNKLLRMYKG